MNRAVQGDVVVVQVFPEREWKAPADEVVDQEGICVSLTTIVYLTMSAATLKNDDAEDSLDEEEEEEDIIMKKESRVQEKTLKEGSSTASQKQPTGRVVGIIKRNWRA